MVEAWWEIMSQNSLLTQIAMSTTALQLERKLGRRELYQSSELIFGCVRLLQERLDDDAQAVSDETLIGVSQLIALEVSTFGPSVHATSVDRIKNDTGNVKTVRLHTQALHNMVNLRGGLDMVNRSSPIAASVVFWYVLPSLVSAIQPLMEPIGRPW